MHENFGEARTAVLVGPGKRDLRLDLLRGIGQWMIFLDHIPYNFLNWFTLRNYGFSDAAEIFVFISGYSIGFAYGPAIKAGQFLAGTKRLWTRASQLYVAHIFLFLFFTAQIARTAARLEERAMQTVTTIRLDIAKSVFQIHGVDGAGQVAIRRQLKRGSVLVFFQKLPSCLVGMEACGSSHH
jgi:hypothetical protein